MRIQPLILILALFASFSSVGQGSYEVNLYRAAPGKLMDLIDDIKIRANALQGNDQPLVIRHSQGDHWDLMIIRPASDHVWNPSFGDPFYEMVAYHEDLTVEGPSVPDFQETVKASSYFHVEMFVALPGKHQELYKEREMENVYLENLDRPRNFIFSKVRGAEWDVFTLGAYTGLKHYAESADIPIEDEEEAAVKAGFKSVTDISPYLRSLILKHNDTLAGKVEY